MYVGCMLSSFSHHVPDPSQIFQNACKEFRDTLTEKDRELFKEFPNAESMLKAINQEAESHPVHKTRLTHCCKGIHSFANILSPFFEIVELFVQSHPEIAAIAWGSLRLVFKLGSNHVEFLERVCKMFENMSMLLPAYEEYVDKFQSRLRYRGARPSDRIFRALAYIYSDLLQFCFDICKVFTRKRSKLLMLKSSFAYTTPWRPFDVRYDRLLQRWDEHRKIIELEMSVSASIEQFETSNRVEEMLSKFEGDWSSRTTYTNILEQRDIDELVHQLKCWINPPLWAHLFENSQSRRYAHTTEWFLKHPTVSCWLSRAETVNGDSSFSALSVQGKPGYGKSTLCTTLIEHIQRQWQANALGQSASSGASPISYFYFDKQRSDSASASGALRAILAQLLHAFRDDPDILDIITILWNENTNGQMAASKSEVVCALRLLLTRVDRLFWVIDGIDECHDYLDFFQYVKELCNIPNFLSLALFSRPSLDIPRDLDQNLYRLDLHTSMNFEPIKTFLGPKMKDLLADGVISSDKDVEDVTNRIASRANGMFLWVRLLLDYLQSPNLSLRQRRDGIQDLNRLEGLDSLYHEILTSLEQSSWWAARFNMIRAFHFVSYAERPLDVDELKYAIAIPLGRKVDPDDTIPDFSRSLSRMSGALIELDSEGKARFVHVSVLEYLTDATRQDTTLDSISRLVKDKALAQRSCALCCLAYLLYSVPPEPLSGEPQVSPDRSLQKARYPFLEYAVEFWSVHLLKFLAILPMELSDEDEALLKLGYDFLSTKRAIMVWIEASWMIKVRPQIGHNYQYKDILQKFISPSPISSERTDLLKHAAQMLHQLASDLKALNAAWEKVLVELPSEIWEPSIAAFNKSCFWESVPGSNIVAHFDTKSTGAFRPICLKSQVSPDGQHLGIARLAIVSQNQAATPEWKIIFEHWSLEPYVKTTEVSFRLPSASLRPFLDSIKILEEPSECVYFQFPVAISPDLRRIVVPGCVAVIDESRIAKTRLESQSLVIQTINFDLSPELMGNMPFKIPLHPFNKTYALLISDTREFIMTIHDSHSLVDLTPTWSSQLRLATVYRDATVNSTSEPSYRYLTSIAFKPCASVEDSIALHPSLPLVAIKYRSLVLRREPKQKQKIIASNILVDEFNTALWGFSSTGNDVIKQCRTTSSRLEFQDDGTFFQGERLLPDKDSHHLRKESTQAEQDRSSANQVGIFNQTMAATSNPEVQKFNTVIRSNNATGTHFLSSLERANSGAIVMQTLREDGLMLSQAITQLPEWAANIADPTVIRGAGRDRGVVQIVVNRANRAFESYRIHAAADKDDITMELPLVLEREQNTIPTFVGYGSYSPEGGIEFRGERRRLERDESDTYDHKRRRLLGD
ncbi:hypothetical protein F5Y19DRAFT_439227 [Xylariaceae sp. FL1651]|nr:hypothetical protein F5Y19DRAFT_439227 [Xylariaceae sp. FL1651]